MVEFSTRRLLTEVTIQFIKINVISKSFPTVKKEKLFSS